MARVPYVRPETAGPEIRPIYDAIERTIGRVSNFMQVLGNVPWLLRWTFPLGIVAQRGGHGLLDARTKSLAILRVSHVNSCHY